MAVFRINKTNDYTVMSNHHFRNTEMSLKAKGLLSLMLSLPNDWDYSITGLTNICKESKDSIATALKELEKHGYLIRKPTKNEKGQFECEYFVYEEPQGEEPIRKNRCGKSASGKTDAENPPQLNTNKLNTNKLNTKDIYIGGCKGEKKKTHKETHKDLIEAYTENTDLKEALERFVEMRKMTKGFTVNALKLGLNKLDNLATTDSDKIVIVNESVINSWKSFYPLKRPIPPKVEKKADEHSKFNITKFDV